MEIDIKSVIWFEQKILDEIQDIVLLDKSYLAELMANIIYDLEQNKSNKK